MCVYCFKCIFCSQSRNFWIHPHRWYCINLSFLRHLNKHMLKLVSLTLPVFTVEILHHGLLPVKSGRYVSPRTYGETGLLLIAEASDFDGQLCFLLLLSCLPTATRATFALPVFSIDFTANVNADGISSTEGRLVRFPRTAAEWDSTVVSGTSEEP